MKSILMVICVVITLPINSIATSKSSRNIWIVDVNDAYITINLGCRVIWQPQAITVGNRTYVLLVLQNGTMLLMDPAHEVAKWNTRVLGLKELIATNREIYVVAGSNNVIVYNTTSGEIKVNRSVGDEVEAVRIGYFTRKEGTQAIVLANRTIIIVETWERINVTKYISKPIIIGDMDNDGYDEIISNMETRSLLTDIQNNTQRAFLGGRPELILTTRCGEKPRVLWTSRGAILYQQKSIHEQYYGGVEYFIDLYLGRSLLLRAKFNYSERPQELYKYYICPGDLDGDGDMEVFLMVNTTANYAKVFIVDCYRRKVEKVLHAPLATSPPMVADIDNDRRVEVLYMSGNKLMVIDDTTYQVKQILEIVEECQFYPIVANLDPSDKELEMLLVDGERILIYDIFSEKTHIVWQGTHGDETYSRNTLKIDGDADMLPDRLEEEIETSKTDPDTDNDQLPDGWEYMNNLDPLGPQDATLDNDNDGLNNIAEYEYGGDPWDSDTDDDGLSDYDEAQIGTDLRLSDTDGDGYSDGYEVSHGTDPLDPDDYPVPLIVRYWWVPVVCVAVIVVLVVFFHRRGVLVRKA